MKKEDRIKNVYIDEDNVLHYERWYWKDYHKDITWDLSNKALGEHHDMLPLEVCEAILKTGEYEWIKGDNFSSYFPEVYHKCWEAIPTKEDARHCGNVSSNPGYGFIKVDDCRDVVFTRIGKYTLHSYKSGNPLKTYQHIECPRCRVIWAIDQYQKELCPKKLIFIRKMYSIYEWFYYKWKHLRKGNKKKAEKSAKGK